jgi:hypothetical protein
MGPRHVLHRQTGRVELVRRRERLQARAGPFGSHLARIAAPSCASAGSHRRSHVARQRTAPGSAASAGSSSEPSPGYTSSSGCSSATTAATTSTKPSLDSAAGSSATGDPKTHCDSISKYRLDRSGSRRSAVPVGKRRSLAHACALPQARGQHTSRRRCPGGQARPPRANRITYVIPRWEPLASPGPDRGGRMPVRDYCVVVDGVLSNGLGRAFEGMSLSREEGRTVLVGNMRDQGPAPGRSPAHLRPRVDTVERFRARRRALDRTPQACFD